MIILTNEHRYAKELKILKWAAGAEIDINNIEQVDEDWLFQANLSHALTGRLLKKILQTYPSWATNAFIEKLHEEDKRVVAKVKNQISVTKKIAESAGNNKLIIIKGFSTYILTGEDSVIRYSSDIDVFCEDEVLFAEKLQELGFIRSSQVAQHEFANFTKDDLKIDLHKYYPFFSYPSQVLALDFDPRKNRDIWIQNGEDIKFAEIKYPDLYENSLKVDNFLILKTNMLVLLLCFSVFKTYVWEPFKVPTLVKLSELADIYELTKQKDFNTREFIGLVYKYNGQQAVDFVNYLFRTYFEINLFKNLPENGFKYPQRYTGILISMMNTDYLLQRERRDIFKNLLTSKITANTIGRGKVYSVAISGENQVKRVITWVRNDLIKPRLAFEFSLTWSDAGLFFGIMVYKDERECEDVIAVHFDIKSIRWTHKNGEINLKTKSNGESVYQILSTVDCHQSGCFIPWEILSKTQNNTIDMLIHVLRKNSNGENIISSMLPLEVIVEH